MAFPNSAGRVLAGTWGRVSIDNEPLPLQVDAGAVGWWDDATPMTVRALPNGDVALFVGEAGAIASRGIHAVGNTGFWAVTVNGGGIVTSRGDELPGMFVHAASPDGAFAYTPHANFPVTVREADGKEWEASPGPAHGIRLYGGKRALVDGHNGYRFIGVSSPIGPTGHWLDVAKIGGIWWCAYQIPAGAVLRRHDDPTRGYLYPTPNTFGLRLREVNGLPFVCWSKGAGAQPGDQDWRLQNPLEPMVILPITEPAPTPKPPTPEPPTPEPPDMDFPDVRATLATVYGKYPAPPSDGDRAKILNEVAWIHRATGWGLSAKPSGHSILQPRTGKKIASDILQHKPSNTLWDVFTDTGLMWGQADPHGQDDTRPWLPPVEPEGATEPTPPNPPTPPQPPAGDYLPRDVFEAFVTNIVNSLGTLEHRMDRLEATPTPQPPTSPTKFRVRGSTSRDLYHSHQIDLEVVPEK